MLSASESCSDVNSAFETYLAFGEAFDVEFFGALGFYGFRV